MNLLFALISLALQADPEFGPERVIEEYDFSIRTPKGWEAKPALPPQLVQLTAPQGGPAGGQMDLSYFEPQEPMALAVYVEELRGWVKRHHPDHKIVTDQEIKCAGRAGWLVVYRAKRGDGKEFVEAKSVVARSLVELLLVDARSDAADGERTVALVKRVLGGVTLGLPRPKAEDEGLGRIAEKLRGTPPPALVAESWQLVLFKERRLGRQRQTVRPETVDGRPGYAFETEAVLADDEGGRRVTKARGAFALDGSSQRAEIEDTLEDKKRGRRAYTESVTLLGREAVAVRDVNGVRGEARFRVAEGTYLTDAADVVRRVLALGGKEACAMLVLPAFADEPRIETIEVQTAPGEPLAVFVKSARRKNLQYFFEADGTLQRVSVGRSPLCIERCTREQALKP